MSTLEDEVEEVETSIEELRTANSLQDDRLNIIDEAVNDNVNEIDGNRYTLISVKTRALETFFRIMMLPIFADRLKFYVLVKCVSHIIAVRQ